MRRLLQLQLRELKEVARAMPDDLLEVNQDQPIQHVLTQEAKETVGGVHWAMLAQANTKKSSDDIVDCIEVLSRTLRAKTTSHLLPCGPVWEPFWAVDPWFWKGYLRGLGEAGKPPQKMPKKNSIEECSLSLSLSPNSDFFWDDVLVLFHPSMSIPAKPSLSTIVSKKDQSTVSKLVAWVLLLNSNW